MKKIASLLITVCLLIGCLVACGGVNTDNGEKDENNKSKSKYDEAFELVEEGKYEEAYKIFEELGDYKDAKEQLEKFRYVPIKITNMDICVEVIYNEKNLPEQFKMDGELLYSFVYDADGKVIQEVSMSPYEGSKYDYSYDEKGNIVKKVVSSRSGNKRIYEYVYDENGKLIREIRTYDESYKYIFDYTYDEKGNIIKEESVGNDGYKSSAVIEYIYDERENVIKKVRTTSGGSKHIYDYTYNENGNVIREVETDRDHAHVNSINDYTYDEKGNVIKKVRTNSQGRKYIYDYVYDENGNIIKRVCTAEPGGEVVQYETEYTFIYSGYCLPKMVEEFLESGIYVYD